MSVTTTGQWINQFVSPQLLQEFKNYKDDFVGVIPGASRSAITADGLRLNKLINNVGFYVNNTANFVAKKMDGEKTLVEWEKYDTDSTEVDDAEIRYLAYDKRNEVRVKHSEAFKMGIRDHILWKFAPSDNTNANMPVAVTTGGSDPTGRKRLIFADLVAYLEKVKKLNLPKADELYMVLCPEHATDLILDRDSSNYFANANIFFDATTGKVKSVMGFKFYENNSCPVYNQSLVKKPVGSATVAGDQNASLFFYAPNSVYHLESVKILYKPETIDTESADPKSILRTQTYGLVDRIVDYGFGSIVSGQ